MRYVRKRYDLIVLNAKTIELVPASPGESARNQITSPRSFSVLWNSTLRCCKKTVENVEADAYMHMALPGKRQYKRLFREVFLCKTKFLSQKARMKRNLR